MWVVELLAPDSDHLLVFRGGQVDGQALQETVLNSRQKRLRFPSRFILPPHPDWGVGEGSLAADCEESCPSSRNPINPELYSIRLY